MLLRMWLNLFKNDENEKAKELIHQIVPQWKQEDRDKFEPVFEAIIVALTFDENA